MQLISAAAEGPLGFCVDAFVLGLFRACLWGNQVVALRDWC
jgi:hypothetical protein